MSMGRGAHRDREDGQKSPAQRRDEWLACPPFAGLTHRRRLTQGDRTAMASLLGITSTEAAKLIKSLAHLEAEPRRSR